MNDVEYTPAIVEQKLRRLMNEMYFQYREDAENREELRAAKHALKLADSKKKVELGGEGTVAERDALVFLATEEEHLAFGVAQVKFENGIEYMRVLEKQMSALQSIGSSVRQAYNAIGVVEP